MLPLDLVRLVCGLRERMKLEYFVTGSVASSYYGEFRNTHDIDVVIELPSWRVHDFCAAFPDPEWYVDEETAKRAAAAGDMFNILHIPSGLKADIMVFRGTPFDESRLFRARRVELPAESGGGSAMFAAAEDVILKKLEFFRERGSDKHLRDIASMLKVSGPEIDLAYIED